MRPEQTRTYDRASSVVFLKTDAPFGGLSNMAGGFPLRVNEIRIRTSEALYQACRFPHRPEVQALIIEQKSPMTAKMKSKPYRRDSRPDWDHVRVKIMRWCLRVKLAQNWRAFSELLLETGERSIVEESRKDAFWGAKATDVGTLVGMNVLGRLLMELREAVKAEGRESLIHVKPLAIPDFLLGGRPIEIVDSQAAERDVEPGKAAVTPDYGDADGRVWKQPSLFDEPVAREALPAAYSAGTAKSVRVADLTPYPEYRDSGLQWLGPVPGHWEVRPAFGAFVPTHERNHGMKEKTVLSLSYGRIVIKPAEKLHGLVPESFETYQIVNPGDIVLRTTDLQNDHTSLRVGMVRDRGVITSAYLALRTSGGVSPEFGFQFLNVWDSSKAIYGFGSGLRQNLDFSHFKRMPVAVPPPDEQAAIVRFLDWANGRLERAIRAKRKVIALLNEQKQAIIHRAVTRGLDPSVPLRPSGIPWLGDIPEHWEVRKLRFLFRYAKGGRAAELTKEYIGGNPGPFPVYSGQTEAGGLMGRISWHEFEFLAPVVFVSTVGARAMTTRLVQGQFSLSQNCALIIPRRDDVVLAFFESVFQRLFAYERASISLIMQPSLRFADLNRFFVPHPPHVEQAAIVRFLSQQVAARESAISRLEREIELLREYRTRLVADVVTGKLDVREAAARLPDGAAPDAVEDDTDPSIDPEAIDDEAAA